MENTPVVQKPAGALAVSEPSPEVVQRLQDALESLQSFGADGMKLDTIKFGADGFTLVDGEPAVDKFEGIMVFTKQSNVFYEKPFKAGQNLPPDCASSDGIRPDSGEKKQHTDCATCPMNQFGSSTTGDGKRCKNTRPTFFLVGAGVIPRVLRVPPTSLKNIKKYALNVATNFGSLWAVKTEVSIYKEEAGQTYNNIRFKVAGRVVAETKSDQDGFITDLGRKDVDLIRGGWMQLMKEGNFGIDEHTANPVVTTVPMDEETKSAEAAHAISEDEIMF